MFEFVEVAPGRWRWEFVLQGAIAARSPHAYDSRGKAEVASLAWSREVDRAGKAVRRVA